MVVDWNAVTVYGLGDGSRVWILVHSDCLDGISLRIRTGGGDGVGARLDRTAWVDGGDLGSEIHVLEEWRICSERVAWR